jgi:hypothetical protein
MWFTRGLPTLEEVALADEVIATLASSRDGAGSIDSEVASK